MRKRGYHVFRFLSHSTEKLRKGSLPFQKFSGMDKNYGYEMGGISFSSKIFCLTVPKNFVGRPFNVSENFRYRKILCIRRGYHYSPLKIFCLTIAEKVRREILLCFKKKCIENFHA